MKIAIGLSGGVDSSISAYLLKEQGHELIGLTMKIWDDSFPGKLTGNACFGPDEVQDIEEAKNLSKFLGIPYHVIDLSKEYTKTILKYFKEEYMSGRTPNPCIKCNQQMKFNLLLLKAKEENIQFDKFATGHYANVEFDKNRNRYLLKKGKDPNKDQSYFLGLLKQDQLSQIIFPLGNYTKDQVKNISKNLKLKLHEKKESQDFYSGNYEDLLDKLPDKGKITLTNGTVLGTHKGICFYTVGQRKGLGVSYKEPLYVIEIRKYDNTVIVGTEKELFGENMIVSGMNWISINKIENPITAKVKIRYKHSEANALITPLENNKVKVKFEKPQRAISPGQFAVIYDDDIVIGGGIIE